MCGICGVYGWINHYMPSTESSTLDYMNSVLNHRGPDKRGTWLGDGIFLGICRLSIIDLACGQQPIWNEDNTCCIIYNGELYNFLDLRPELEAKGHVFRTCSDTEVILHVYEEWGPDCLRRFGSEQ